MTISGLSIVCGYRLPSGQPWLWLCMRCEVVFCFLFFVFFFLHRDQENSRGHWWPTCPDGPHSIRPDHDSCCNNPYVSASDAILITTSRKEKN